MAMVSDSQGEEGRRLSEPEVVPRALTIGTLVFSIIFCAFVFWSGWGEAPFISDADYKEFSPQVDPVPAPTARPPAQAPPIAR
jgi:hypothetical protein